MQAGRCTLKMAGREGCETMDYITTKEAAELQGCTVQYLRKLCKTGAVECKVSKSVKGKDMYLIPVSALSEQAQHKYGKQLRESMQLLPETAESKPTAKRKKQREKKPLEAYSAQERDRIAMWCQIIKDWMDTRTAYGKRSEADPLFVAKCKLEHPELEISVDILYRKYAAYKQDDYDGILGIRGGWNKGKSRIPSEIWNVYLYYWLDDNQPTAAQSYLNTVEWCRDFKPELLDSIPSERAFRYRVARDVDDYIKCMARDGQKACHDRYAPYIVRWYDDLNANDCWIADNHTIDVQSVDDKDKQHRLYLTGFLDAKSGVLVGYNITDTPSSQSTILALRNGIRKHGIPKVIYVDNGREFLTRDVGGLGHRTHKNSLAEFQPPPIFARLGIEMRNAIVRNARAKPIERTFRTLKEQFSRIFSGFNGGSVAERKESLKNVIKKGLLPRDYVLRDALDEWIDGIYNCEDYGGSEAQYKGMSRIDVWNQSIAEVGMRTATDEDLNLMLARSTRMQKIKRNGVKIVLHGEELWYMDPTSTFKMIGQSVYVRYDPADLRYVRLYDEQDRCLCTWGLADYLYRDYLEENPDAVGDAMRILRSINGYMRDGAAAHLKKLDPAQRIAALDMTVRRAHRNKLEHYKIQKPSNIIPVRANEKQAELAVGAEDMANVIDIKRMADNAEKERKG